jgi:transposase, IS30 family
MSHVTIYRFIRHDRKPDGTLFRYMRGMTKRHMKRHTGIGFRGHMPEKRHKSERPAELQTRQTLGHWEGDTVIGQDKFACLLTLVERKSGLAIIKKLTSRPVVQSNKTACKAISQRHGQFNTFTSVNGIEFHGFKLLEKKFGVTCYFATPYQSWECGSKENLNGLNSSIRSERNMHEKSNSKTMQRYRPRIKQSASQTTQLSNAFGYLQCIINIVALGR